MFIQSDQRGGLVWNQRAEPVVWHHGKAVYGITRRVYVGRIDSIPPSVDSIPRSIADSIQCLTALIQVRLHKKAPEPNLFSAGVLILLRILKCRKPHSQGHNKGRQAFWC